VGLQGLYPGSSSWGFKLNLQAHFAQAEYASAQRHPSLLINTQGHRQKADALGHPLCGSGTGSFQASLEERGTIQGGGMPPKYANLNERSMRIRRFDPASSAPHNGSEGRIPKETSCNCNCNLSEDALCPTPYTAPACSVAVAVSVGSSSRRLATPAESHYKFTAAAVLASGCHTLRIPTPASLAGTIYILVPACNKAYTALGPAVKQHLVPLLKVPLGILLAGSCSSSSDAACQHLCCCLHLITLKHHILVYAFQPAAMIFVLMHTRKSHKSK